MLTTTRYALTLAYDGTDFRGWQAQTQPPEGDATEPTVLRTVQLEVTRAVQRICRDPSITVTGASRTDTGVHAGGTRPDGSPGGQLASFITTHDPATGVGWSTERGAEVLVRAMNAELPRDILCLAARAVPLAFHPIRAATNKQYTYRIVSGHTRPLWDRRYVFHTWHDLDPHAMADAAKHLVGEHDFASFAKVNHGRETTVRTVFACDASHRSTRDGEEITITVSGSGFLYNMVRIIAGTLMEAGRGRIDPATVPELLAVADRRQNPAPTLPPARVV
ncbi:MAG: tRNA pseudouridine synthase A [Planctomycetota bacterium]